MVPDWSTWPGQGRPGSSAFTKKTYDGLVASPSSTLLPWLL